MTDNANAIRMELDAALTALATAWHALDMAAYLARQDDVPGMTPEFYRYRVLCHDVSLVLDRVKKALR